ncbi:hypothetical protein D9M72_512490 [compost metagenome]
MGQGRRDLGRPGQAAHQRPHQYQAVPGHFAGGWRPDPRVLGDPPGRDRHGDRLDHQLVAAGQGTEPVLAAVPDARLQGAGRADAGRSRQVDLRHAGEGRRGAAGLGRERLPRGVQLQARAAQAGRPQGPEAARGGLAAVHRDLQRAGRQPDPDELGRRAAGDGLGRGRWPGKPAVGVRRRQAVHGRPEVRHHLGLRG